MVVGRSKVNPMGHAIEMEDSQFYELLHLAEDLTEQVKFLKGELKQLANFNPDWDMLQATRENLREAYRDLTQHENAMRAIQAATSDKVVQDITDRALAGTFGDDERTVKGTH